MSEWYDNQTKPNSNFRRLLKERTEKANPRSKLTSEEAKRNAKLETEWQEQLALRETLKDKPSDLKRYEEKLKEAIMMRKRSDAYHRKGNKASAYKLDSKCESLCEDALEILQEIVAADASLQIWFDRNLDFAHGSLIDASLGNLPRLVTSRSIEKLSDDSRLVKKIDVKISVVERAIYSIGRDTAVPSKGDSFMLEKFLNTDF